MNLRLFWIYTISTLLSGLLLCAEPVCGQNYKYLFAGHIYEWHTGGSKVDPRMETLDYSKYDQIWLGGDICSEASLNHSTLEYLDGIFNLSAPGNHWSLGNHDIRNGNVQWIKDITGRETYYTYHSNGLTTILMNTCLTPFHCEDLDDQFRMIQTVCDTIQNSTNLVLLMHHAVWDNIPGLPEPGEYSHTDFPFWNPNCFASNDNTFKGQVYPLLLKVLAKGIKVLCITGDMGANAKMFQRTSDEGVVFLGCGLNNSFYTDPDELENQAKDLVLIFTHNSSSGLLTWEFVELNTLL